MIWETNTAVEAFYARPGYATLQRTIMQKKRARWGNRSSHQLAGS